MYKQITSGFYIQNFIYSESDIKIWKFEKAPQELKNLSTSGGDEDWIAVCKKDFYESNYIPFLTEGCVGSIGPCDIEIFEFEGYLILIGSHA